ncbi:MAG: hypothetical protein ACREXK_10910 [Gammaproteobacteria bacterium]
MTPAEFRKHAPQAGEEQVRHRFRLLDRIQATERHIGGAQRRSRVAQQAADAIEPQAQCWQGERRQGIGRNQAGRVRQIHLDQGEQLGQRKRQR